MAQRRASSRSSGLADQIDESLEVKEPSFGESDFLVKCWRRWPDWVRAPLADQQQFSCGNAAAAFFR